MMVLTKICTKPLVQVAIFQGIHDWTARVEVKELDDNDGELLHDAEVERAIAKQSRIGWDPFLRGFTVTE